MRNPMLSLSLKFITIWMISSAFSYSAHSKTELATFAGGCFWCMEPPFEKLAGVESVISGFSGGSVKNPAYKTVAQGKTQHIEVVQVKYDSSKISYATLLKTYWKNIDPTDPGGQFYDRGHQYSTAIFYHNDEQKNLAEASKAFIESKKYFSEPIATKIRKYLSFYPAGDEHQDFYKKNPQTIARYKSYRKASGRDEYIAKNWADRDLNFEATQIASKKYVKPPLDEIKKNLTETQFYVTQKNGTERAFNNEFWNHKAEGIYVDIVTGEPLFSSKDKFKSGTGWPSFTRPLVADHVIEVTDRSHGMSRVEVRSKIGNSHLGHVFNDGPKPTGLRYCINSAALRFIPKKDLKKEGYSEFLSRF